MGNSWSTNCPDCNKSLIASYPTTYCPNCKDTFAHKNQPEQYEQCKVKDDFCCLYLPFMLCLCPPTND